MNQDSRKESFLEIGRGAMLERFDYEMEKVIDNIIDPNTPATKPRKITVTLTITPAPDRQSFSYGTIVKPTLQSTNPIVGSVAIMPDTNGVLSLMEMVPQIPGQMNTANEEQREPTVIQFRKQA